MTAVNTTYFTEQVVRDCVNGHCHHFAIALTRITGWPIGILWSDPPPPEEGDLSGSLMTHVFCVAPDGQSVDVEGVHDQDTLASLYQCRRPRIELTDEPGLFEFCEPGNPRVMTPRVNDLSIKAADKFIRGSEKFTALLQQLNSVAKAPGMD